MNHTPGPWELNNWTVMGNKQDKVQGKIVARTHHDRKLMHVGEAESNASLISAAPELLEACKHVIDCGMECPGCTTMLRAAISKAEGLTK